MKDVQNMKFENLRKKYLKSRPLTRRIASLIFNKKTKRKIKIFFGVE